MGSEDGNIFLWDINRSGNHFRDAKQKAYEYFNPFMISKMDQHVRAKPASLKVESDHGKNSAKEVKSENESDVQDEDDIPHINEAKQ